MTTEQTASLTPLQAINQEINDLDLLPGWDRPGGPAMWAEPRADLEPAAWSFSSARDLLERSSPLLTMEQTERRNLILVNPAPGNIYPTTRTQAIAYQMILPSEHARTHRHSPHAGRLVLEADPGAYTVVDGVKTQMTPGDVVLTPGGSWHGHGHDGNAPAFWIDFLDIPLVQLLNPMFFEPFPDGWQTPDDNAVDERSLVFPWSETSQRLASAEPDPDGIYGRRIELGAPALATVGLYMQALENGVETVEYRTTANIQYCVVEGTGTTRVGTKEFTWSRGDVIAVPAWLFHRHQSSSDAVLLAITDEPLMRYCGYLRQQRSR